MTIDEWSWEKVLCSDPELLLRQASRQSDMEDDSPLALQHRALDEKRQKESLRNPTEAMKEIMWRMEEREREREQMTWQQQLQHFNKKSKQQLTGISEAASAASVLPRGPKCFFFARLLHGSPASGVPHAASD